MPRGSIRLITSNIRTIEAFYATFDAFGTSQELSIDQWNYNKDS